MPCWFYSQFRKQISWVTINGTCGKKNNNKQTRSSVLAHLLSPARRSDPWCSAQVVRCLLHPITNIPGRRRFSSVILGEVCTCFSASPTCSTITTTGRRARSVSSRAHGNLFCQLSRNWNSPGSCMSHATAASPKPSFRAPLKSWRRSVCVCVLSLIHIWRCRR